MAPRRRFLLFFLCSFLCALVCASEASAQFAMPDAKEMSGIPRPVEDLPNGAVSVRLIRGSLSNNIVNHPVKLLAGGKEFTVNTDESGRAQFNEVPPGSTVKTVADVDGEHLESREFPAPTRGGIRLMLVATDKSKPAAPANPPVSGTVAIGNQSRIVVQPNDENVEFYYLLDVSNTNTNPVIPTTPFVIELPRKASGTTIMEGSSAQAKVKGSSVVLEGPIPSGHTFVQVAYMLSGEGGTIDIAQKFPASIESLAVVVKKVGDTTLSSPQIKDVREMPADNDTFIAGQGGELKAGQPLVLTISGFPHHSSAPRTIALVLAIAIAAIGCWAASRPIDDGAAAAARKRLIARREKLFADLVRLEHDRRNGRVDDRRYAARREELVSALEQVYGALDSHDAGPGPADRAGLAA